MKKIRNHALKFVAIFMITLGAQLSGSAVLFADAVNPAAPVGAPPTAEVETADSITLDFKDADINTVLRVLSIKSHMNIVAGPEVKGTVTIRLENVPWEKALDVVLRTYDYVYEKDGNVIRVTTRERMAQEPVVTSTFVLNYTRASEVMVATQEMLTERGRMQIADRTNTLVITDIPTNLYRMSQVIEKLDKITPQAYVDSKIVNTSLATAENLGLEWQTGGNSNIAALTGASRPTTFPFVTATEKDQEDLSPFIKQFLPITAAGTAPNQQDLRSFPLINTEDPTNRTFALGTLDFSGFSAVLQMLRERSDTKIVSNPRIVVLNNQTARVQVGSDVPLPRFERNENTGSVEISGFNFREVGVVLNVTPHINSQEEILVDLNPEVSSQGANVNFGAFQIPSFAVTKAITQVLIRSGQTIAIGGLLTDGVTTAEAKVPYLSDVPFFGKIFRSKRQTPGSGNTKAETLFFVTVTMVDSEGQPSGDLASSKKYRLKSDAQSDDANKADAANQNMTPVDQGSDSGSVPTENESEIAPAADEKAAA